MIKCILWIGFLVFAIVVMLGLTGLVVAVAYFHRDLKPVAIATITFTTLMIVICVHLIQKEWDELENISITSMPVGS